MNRLCTPWVIVLTSLFCGSSPLHADDNGNLRVYLGTYTNDTSLGIYVSTLDSATGKLTPAELAAEAKNPSFLAIHPSRKFLYAANEIFEFEGKKTGSVSAFSIDAATGKLTLLNQCVSMGRSPCHLTIDAAGKNVLVANYHGGSVAVIPLESNGRLVGPHISIQHTGSSVDKRRQASAHAHSINLDPTNKFAFVADLGLDKILIYQFDGLESMLVANDPFTGVVAPGSGPRHFAFHPSNKYAFVNNELTSTVTSFAFDPTKGSLTEIQTLSTLPEPTPGNSTAETVVHPSGKFVYVSNRGHNSLAIFQCDPETGQLMAIGHASSGGKTPRNFNIDPSGRYAVVANQDSNKVVVLHIDQETGKLTPTGNSIEVGRPVCVRFMRMD